MDDLINQLGGATGGTDPGAALGGLANAIQGEGGIDGLLGKLKDAGLGDQVDFLDLDRAEPGRRAGPARSGAGTGHGRATGAGVRDRYRFPPADAGRVPAPDRRHAHAERPDARRRPERRRRVPAGSRWVARRDARRQPGPLTPEAAGAAGPARPGDGDPPSTDVHATPRPGWVAAGGSGPASCGHGARRQPGRQSHRAVPASRSRSSGCRPSAPTARPTSSRSGSGGTARRCWCSPSPMRRRSATCGRGRGDAGARRRRRGLRYRPARGQG